MARLVPRVGEENMHAVEHIVGQHVAHDFHCIVLHDAQIADALFVDLLEQAADTRGMHFEREVVILRVILGDEGGGFAHAETDLQNFWRSAAKGSVKVQWLSCIGYAIARHQRVEAALLCG
jgi:hypothetical protein